MGRCGNAFGGIARAPEKSRAGPRAYPTTVYQMPSANRGAKTKFHDLDCADFGSQWAAQTFMASRDPGNRHGLDGDSDGIACERLP